MSACVPTYMLASRLIDRGHELVAGGAHHLPRQRDRARADGAQRPRRHEVRHSVPRLLPRRRSASSARTCRRCCARSSPAAGSASRPGSAAGRSTRSCAVFIPGLGAARRHCRSSASTRPQLGCFLFFWAINMLVIYKGIESIRMLLEHQGAAADRARPRCCWPGPTTRPAASAPMLAQPSQFAAGRPEGGPVLAVLLPRRSPATSASGPRSRSTSPTSPATPTRSATRSLGQALGLPTTMALFSFIGVAVTSATVVIYGETIWDPVVVLTQVQEPGRARRRDALALHRHAGHQHRRQRGQPGQRLRPPLRRGGSRSAPAASSPASSAS